MSELQILVEQLRAHAVRTRTLPPWQQFKERTALEDELLQILKLIADRDARA
jgi:hypothetical protein